MSLTCRLCFIHRQRSSFRTLYSCAIYGVLLKPLLSHRDTLNEQVPQRGLRNCLHAVAIGVVQSGGGHLCCWRNEPQGGVAVAIPASSNGNRSDTAAVDLLGCSCQGRPLLLHGQFCDKCHEAPLPSLPSALPSWTDRIGFFSSYKNGFMDNFPPVTFPKVKDTSAQVSFFVEAIATNSQVRHCRKEAGMQCLGRVRLLWVSFGPFFSCLFLAL